MSDVGAVVIIEGAVQQSQLRSQGSDINRSHVLAGIAGTDGEPILDFFTLWLLAVVDNWGSEAFRNFLRLNRGTGRRG